MDDKKDSNDQPLDESKYKKEDGKFTDDAVKTYMFEQKIGKDHQYFKKEDENKDNNENGNGKLEGAKA